MSSNIMEVNSSDNHIENANNSSDNHIENANSMNGKLYFSFRTVMLRSQG